MYPVYNNKENSRNWYYINDKHKENYQVLLSKYPIEKHEDIEYLCNIYIAAIPDIFMYIELAKIDGNEPGSTPLLQLFEYEIDDGRKVLHPYLEDGEKALARIALSMYNSNEIKLGQLLANLSGREDWVKALMQAVKIRIRLQ